MLPQRKSLKKFIFVAVLAASMLSFVGIYLFSSYLHTTLTRKMATTTSEGIAKQTFATMYQLMSQGWTRDQLEDFLHAVQNAYAGTDHTVRIYRGEKVEELYGTIRQATFSPAVRESFSKGEEQLIKSSDSLMHLLPLKAEEKCLLCHGNARQDDVLGVIEISWDFSTSDAQTQTNYLVFFLIAFPFALGISYLLAKLLAGRLDRSMHTFQEKVGAVNTVRDFKELDTRDIDLGFTELNDILHNVNLLTEKLRDVAVDKDILEFEIRLMEKFVITSDIVRDWREYIKDLVIEINHVMDAYSLFTMFRVGEDDFEIEIFWRATPDESTKKTLEAIAFKAIKESPYLDETCHYEIHHNIAAVIMTTAPFRV